MCVQLGLSLTLLAGCDAAEVPDSPGVGETPAEAESASPLPGAPWFTLPDDWDEQHPVLSPNAKLEAHWMALAEAQVEINPADGGGRAWLESVGHPGSSGASPIWRRGESSAPRASVEAGSSHRFEIRFEVGELGIEEGGMIFLNPEAFWHWSPAQTADPRFPGYTTASPTRPGVELRPIGSDGAFLVEGRALESGEPIAFVYGAGDSGARVDRFAEHAAEIMVGVDADGDGFRRWVEDGPELDILAGAAARLFAFGPAESAPEKPIEITLSITDARGNRTLWPSRERAPGLHPDFSLHVLASSTLGLVAPPAGFSREEATHQPLRLMLNPAPGEGTIRLRIEGHGALSGLAVDLPPIVIRDASTRLVWGDLHGHSRLSDGTGTPTDYFSYARDVAGLDVIALTDHDHWGPRPLDEEPEAQAELLATALSFNAPGRFITLPGYEWTSWLHGHRHVLYFDEEAPIFSAVDPATDRPDELWNALRGRPALTFAHHSAGEPVATNWFFAPDPELEPLTEVASVHGASEAADAPVPVRGGIPGNFVRDVLMRGARLGFVGSGDSHDGHPGLAQIDSGQAGLAGIFTPALDRASLLGAMRSRHTFATNGIRPWLDVRLDEVPMGATLRTSTDGTEEGGTDTGHLLRIRYEGTAPVEGVDLVRSGRVATVDGEGVLSYSLDREIPRLSPHEFHYVRIRQEDGGVAWSSPIFAE